MSSGLIIVVFRFCCRYGYEGWWRRSVPNLLAGCGHPLPCCQLRSVLLLILTILLVQRLSPMILLNSFCIEKSASSDKSVSALK